MNMLKERRACWSCLKIGHRLHDCRSRKACGKNGCARTHHRTLHEENQEINISATASAWATLLTIRASYCKVLKQ